MRAFFALFLSALMVGATPTSAAKAPPVSLAKIGKWGVNYDLDSCHLFASFGAGKEKVDILMTKYEPGDSFALTLAGDMFETSWAAIDIAIGFQPTFKMQKLEGIAGKTGTRIPMIVLSGLRFDAPGNGANGKPTPISPELEATITAIKIAALGKTYQLESGTLAKPMAALDTCINDLVVSWGFDPVAQSQLREPVKPVGNAGDWIVDGDYPSKALHGGHNGLVQYRLDVEDTGRVSGCRVLYRSNPDDFADLTCRLLQRRARFRPALDAMGKPLRSFYIGRVRWKMLG